jgi:hypothetical protein
MPPLIDRTGKKYGRLTVLKRTKNIGEKAGWLCLCSCGTLTTVSSSNLSSGHTKSCGCFSKEASVASGKNTKKHGMINTTLYKKWAYMKQRCNTKSNASYDRYGGRGIKVCDEWSDFMNFYRDMSSTYEKGLSIDRIDNNGDYSKDNCRWATPKQQARNRSSCRKFLYDGKKRALSEIVELSGFSRSMLCRRLIDWGWDIKKTINSLEQI